MCDRNPSGPDPELSSFGELQQHRTSQQMTQVIERLKKIDLIIRKSSQPDTNTINEPITYRNIMLEHPPKSSKFTTQGGYITPDNGHIPYKLRE